ncbi:MAG: hypothetical protein HC915_10625 [Anaerolineae bacterium]|nr:hypothetical protein [Anaerolineae bacterium]
MLTQLGQIQATRPANFLDTGGGADAERVAEGLRLILSQPKLKAILIIIFGGITRCDDVARGILGALEVVQPQLPLVVRLAGTRQSAGRQLLRESGLPNLHLADTLYEAVQLTVHLAEGRA